MNNKLTVTIGAFCAFTFSAFAESVRITEENVAFTYETKAEIATPPKILAGIISTDYLNAKDEFTAHEMFAKIEPVITKRIEDAKDTKVWRIEITDQLSEYDFESKLFPTQLTEGTFIPFVTTTQRYAVKFSNFAAYRNVPVDIEAAKKLSGSLQKSRQATILVEGTVKEAVERKINYSMMKTIIFEISKVTIQLKDGTLVGEFTPTEVKK